MYRTVAGGMCDPWEDSAPMSPRHWGSLLNSVPGLLGVSEAPHSCNASTPPLSYVQLQTHGPRENRPQPAGLQEEEEAPLLSVCLSGAGVGDSMTSEVIEDEKQFYSKAELYWKEVPPTVDGMLGGYGHISSIDLGSSRKFLQRFLREGPNKTGTSCALDCGAGIGRITKRLLLPLFRVVDMVDVTEDFLVKAKTYLGEEGKRVRNYFCCGLQDFSPEPESYDVIWIQWVIGHLTDQHLAEFLRRCKRGLRPNGIIVIKDNMAQEGVILDDVDSSVCRDLQVVHGIVRSAGLSLLAQERQENLPDEIYHVYSLALR
ncbi:N-terminal Xaa-Pro-Lys N-methyltransferase 1 [Phyllostomus discolor]|uniref:N-terminal Xaa-Pro-Lys N-methyltransferase 1 n=2 Tax=Phyllostomus discolor TaxID=89673 RepID=A0A834BBJ2_9CHIR|nr:N-terminal Xaa-Pro-Lys N-methyltransferase 1 [Phyllostomus discolor]